MLYSCKSRGCGCCDSRRTGGSSRLVVIAAATAVVVEVLVFIVVVVVGGGVIVIVAVVVVVVVVVDVLLQTKIQRKSLSTELDVLMKSRAFLSAILAETKYEKTRQKIFKTFRPTY